MQMNTCYIWPLTLTPRALIEWERVEGGGLKVTNFAELFREASMSKCADSQWKLTLDEQDGRYVAGVASCVSGHSFRTMLVLERKP